MNLLLNGFRLRFDARHLWCRIVENVGSADVDAWHERLGTDWFTRWTDGRLYCLPEAECPQGDFGAEVKLELEDHAAQRLIAARLTNRMGQLFPAYEPFGTRPFAFLAQKADLVARASRRLRNAPELLDSFSIRPKYELEGKIVELVDGRPEVALVAGVRTHWQIDAQLRDLNAAGVTLGGLHVVWRDVEKGQRRLVGRVRRLSGDTVELSESFAEDSVPASAVRVEGSVESFKRCLTPILGRGWADFDRTRDAEQGDLLTGPGLDQQLRSMHAHLKKGTVLLCPGLRCKVGEQIEVRNEPGHATVVKLPSPQYCFDAARTKLDRQAWPGLVRWGPYSAQSFDRRTPRILLVAPKSLAGRAGQFAAKLRGGVQVAGKAAFAKGLTGTFHLVNPKFEACDVPPPTAATTPAAAYRGALEHHLARESAYDAAVVIVEDRHGEGPAEVNAYLAAKATLLTHGIPVQVCRASEITKPDAKLQYMLQNVAVALYAKLGGVPWTVDHAQTVDDEVVLGMGAAELVQTRVFERQRFVGVTTVFRGDGNYLLSNLSRQCRYEDYPDVLRGSMRDVLADVKQRNNWRPGDLVRVVFHAFKPLKRVEVARIVRECAESVAGEQTLEFAFLTVSNDHGFKLLDLDQKGIEDRYGGGGAKGTFAPERGTVVQLGANTRLVCANGPSLVKRSLSPLPTPLLVSLHPDSTYRDLAYLSDQVLKFTSLSWRSTLPARRPVTIYYSELIAGLLARLEGTPGWSPAVLNTKLKTRKWFL